MRSAIAEIPIVDHHAHALIRIDEPLTPATFAAFFSEGGDAIIRRDHAPNNLVYRRTFHDLATFLGCEATPAAVIAARAAREPGAHARRLVADAGIESFLIDHYFESDSNHSLAEMPGLTGAGIHPVLRLESVLEELIVEHDDLGDLLDAFGTRIRSAREHGTVALKSIIAYRTGLAIGDPGRGDAAQALTALAATARREGKPRLADKCLLDFCLRFALELASELRLPVQIHTGYGDPDLDLRAANPLLLRPLLEDPRYRGAPLVLLHASYPYVRESSYLSSVYGHVYSDVSLVIPFAVSDMRAIWRQMLALAPLSKVLYASDGFSIPELYWTGARWARESLADVLSELIELGALDKREALESARWILHDNAYRLYALADQEGSP